MTVITLYFVECDSCHTRSKEGYVYGDLQSDELPGWVFHNIGNGECVHFCPQCSNGKTVEEIIDDLHRNSVQDDTPDAPEAIEAYKARIKRTDEIMKSVSRIP